MKHLKKKWATTFRYQMELVFRSELEICKMNMANGIWIWEFILKTTTEENNLKEYSQDSRLLQVTSRLDHLAENAVSDEVMNVE